MLDSWYAPSSRFITGLDLLIQMASFITFFSIDLRTYTRATRIKAQAEEHKSAIANHAARNNHVINWEAAKVIDKEGDREKKSDQGSHLD